MKRIRESAAKRLLVAARFYVDQHRLRLNVPNTGERRTRTRNTAGGPKGSTYTVYAHPSKPGEYPHKITGHGQQGVAYQPASVAEVAASLFVRIGYFRPVRYMLVLELFRRRLGLVKTLRDLRATLKRIIGGGAS